MSFYDVNGAAGSDAPRFGFCQLKSATCLSGNETRVGMCRRSRPPHQHWCTYALRYHPRCPLAMVAGEDSGLQHIPTPVLSPADEVIAPTASPHTSPHTSRPARKKRYSFLSYHKRVPRQRMPQGDQPEVAPPDALQAVRLRIAYIPLASSIRLPLAGLVGASRPCGGCCILSCGSGSLIGCYIQMRTSRVP